MRRQFTLLAVLWVAFGIMAAGCRPQQPFYFRQAGDMDHYVGAAQQIEYPDLEAQSLDEVNGAKAPLTLTNPKPESYWDLSLQEAMQIALTNGTVLKSFGGIATPVGPSKVLSASEQLLRGAAVTIHQPAITESHPLYGVEGALSAFDAQFSSSIFWEKNIVPQNTGGFVSQFRPDVFKQDVANFESQIAKNAVTGGQFAIRHDIQYSLDNSSNALKRWPNLWTAGLNAEFRQPFLQGAGVGFNRIAGPGAVPGQPNGVVLARLRVDESLANFEANVRNMVADAERAYWYLYFQYRRLDSAIAGRDAALQTWRQVKARFDIGGKGGGALDEAQSRQQYLRFKAAVQTVQSDLYRAENRLRFLMGLAQSDGRLIRPSDEPTRAKVEFDWDDAHSEALVRSPELRGQKWIIKQREMELIAAKNYLLPRLDAVGRYGWTGIGDDLLDPKRNLELYIPPSGDPSFQVHSAYGSLTTGNFPSWHLGLDLRFPFGFRQGMAGVRHAQLNLVRERKVLQEQELELDHQLGEAFRNVAEKYEVSQTYYNTWLAANREVEAVDAAYQAGTTTLDQVLDAQRRRAEAEVEYYSSLVDYNVAVIEVHFRKGSLLEYNEIYLAEGPWPAKAYFDARRRAIQRDASHLINYGFTQPRLVSRGPYEQHAGAAVPDGAVMLDGVPEASPVPAEAPKPLKPEPIEAPAPVPMEQPTASNSQVGQSEATAGATWQVRSAPGVPTGGQVVSASKVVHNGKPDLKGPELVAAIAPEPATKPAPTQAPLAAAAPPVRAASYQQGSPGSAGSAGTSPGLKWKPVALSAQSDEPVANPSPSATHPSSSGWKTLQHRRFGAGL